MSTDLSTAADLANRLKEARDRAELTQDEVARELGVSTRTLQNWEAGSLPTTKKRRVLRAWLEGQEAA